MNGKNFRRNRGSLFLIALFAIAIGGIVAMKLLPDQSIQDKRDKAIQLKMSIGQIRQALDMKYIVDPSYDPDFSTSIQIKSELQKLADENYLRIVSLSDATIQKHLWNTQDYYYWFGVRNYSQNASFESLQADGSASSWMLIENTKANLDSAYLDAPEIDAYPAQNNLGKGLSTMGKSLKISYP